MGVLLRVLFCLVLNIKIKKYMNYKLLQNEVELQKFIDFLPELKPNECYFLILIARKKWNPESNIPSATKLKRETVNKKDKIIQTIRQMEVAEGIFTNNEIAIPQENLGVYIGYNPRDQYKASFELINKCLTAIKTNKQNINVKSMANDVIQASYGTKNFMDIDVDIKEGEDYNEIVKFIKSVIDEKYLNFFKTSGGFHCLINLNHPDFKSSDKNESDLISPNFGKKWYPELQKHQFKSELNIMSNDLMPMPGCNQGKFVPFMFK